jgi:hypothetical protein
MAIQTGAIKYRGSFKSIRNYMNLHDPNTYAGEKGGANRDLILNNPAFARTRENMNEFNGVGVAVKAIRQSLLNLLPEQLDKHFTARLMKVVKEINRRDDQGVRGKRSIFFSGDRPFLGSMVLNTLEKNSLFVQGQYSFEHPISRAEATLTLTGLAIKPAAVSAAAELTLVERVLAPTPKFFRVVRTIGVVIGLIGASILASPVALPAAIATIGGYLALAGSIVTGVAQTAVKKE